MCTVTFIPTPNGFYLTSNRDESRQRGVAKAPELYTDGPCKLIYPSDVKAGGSWMVLKEGGTAGVLLNGAFVKHVRKPPYRASRGQVLLEIMRMADPAAYLAGMDLKGIEPFTLVLFCAGALWDCRWDGSCKHVHSMDRSSPHIWSSATLYDEAMSNERKRWLREWLMSKEEIEPIDVLTFHRTAGDGDIRNSLVMNRGDQVFTMSVTSIVVNSKDARMVYHDLITGKHTVAALDAANPIAVDREADSKKRLRTPPSWKLKQFFVRLLHWEFWPSHLLYAPVYPYWLWLSLRARSFFFFSAANPQIEYAGFTHERKSYIYRQLPQGYYPRTQFCPAGIGFEAVKRQLQSRGLHFPLIAKPDIGERGAQVNLLRTDQQLESYVSRTRVDFLVQEYVSHSIEAGIFYIRMPGDAKGRVTGIVGKELLSVTGDGRSRIRELLAREPRSLLQTKPLNARYGSFLDTILPKGERQLLVPYGNHCRGAKFIDWSDRITGELEDAVDSICRRIPDFYYGRLDLRFASWEDLLQKQNFSIIEVNGAGSEPAHIYDPGHSLWFAWKEIARHWRLLYRISQANAERRNIPMMSTREGLRLLVAHSRHRKMMEPL